MRILNGHIRLLERRAGLTEGDQILSLDYIEGFWSTRHPSRIAVLAENLWRRCGLAPACTSA
jgi:hypothetical protein